jgi:hypothetical protein
MSTVPDAGRVVRRSSWATTSTKYGADELSAGGRRRRLGHGRSAAAGSSSLLLHGHQDGVATFLASGGLAIQQGVRRADRA